MPGPPPPVAAVRSAVRAVLAPLPAGPVLVACSGGPDSLALAAAGGFVGFRQGRPVGAVVVDHGWRADSAQVARAAAATCRDLGLAPVEVATVPPASGEPRREATARQARYTALAAAGRRLGAVAVLVGHTLDDQAETVLLGLARGSGARSLAGMAADGVLVTPAGEVRVLRPLLGLRRADTEAACAALGLRPWQDPANTDPAHARSRLRAASGLLTELLGPGLTLGLARSADLLRQDADALDAAAAELLAAGLVPGPGPGLLLDVEVLAAAPTAVRHRVLLRAARAAGAPAGALGRRHVLALDALVTRWRGQGAVHLPGGVPARRRCGRLALGGSPARPAPTNPTRTTE